MLTRLSGFVRFGRTARELKLDESLITGVQYLILVMQLCAHGLVIFRGLCLSVLALRVLTSIDEIAIKQVI